MSATTEAAETAAGLLTFLGITQRRASEILGMEERRLSERVRLGTFFWRDFLALAKAEGGGDYLRMLADMIDGEGGTDLPIEAAMKATEAGAETQGTIRKAREDGHYCHWEVLQIREMVDRQHAATTSLKRIVDSLEPGPVPTRSLAAE